MKDRGDSLPKAYVLYNPLAGGGKVKNDLDALEVIIPYEVLFVDITESGALERLLPVLEKEDCLILCGGDGTLNRFANETEHWKFKNEILYFPCGTRNDFAKGFNRYYGDNPFVITKYLKNLPSVTVRGKTCRFLNGIGFGTDGFSYEKMDRLPGRKEIPVRSLLHGYTPVGATVCVDGVRHSFDKVWIAATMFGKFYGGGMIPTPKQEREADHLSLMVFHDSSRLRTLMMFPSIFKGTITKYHKYVSVYSGREITVTFDAPRPLQIDGETVENVISYTARR